MGNLEKERIPTFQLEKPFAEGKPHPQRAQLELLERLSHFGQIRFRFRSSIEEPNRNTG